MPKLLTILTLFAFLAIANGEEANWTAKNIGMADCGFSLPLDASSVFYNPAFAAAFNGGVLSLGYGMPYVGFKAADNQGYLSYVRPLGWFFGAGIHGNYESLSGYSLFRIGPNLTMRSDIAGTLSVGISVDWIQRAYDFGTQSDDPLARVGSANALSFGFGVLWQRDAKLSVGFSAMDVNEPNPSLEDTATAARLPGKYGVGVSYKFSDYITPEISLLMRSYSFGEQKNPEYRIGITGSLPSKMFSWRAGYNPNAFSAGVGFHTDAVFNGIDFDYSLSIPTSSELRSAGATSHYFGVSVWGKKVRNRKGNIGLQKLWCATEPKVGEPCEIRAEIQNTGKIKLKRFGNTLAMDSGKGYKLVYPSQLVDSLAIGETQTVAWIWTPKEAGKYTFRAGADDNGNSFPFISGDIDETNENDNIATLSVTVGGADTLYIEPKYSTLSATQVLVKVEEEPVVPVVFFEKNSAQIDSLGKHILDVIGERIDNNPDVVVSLFGYFDGTEEGGESLAHSRAQALADYFFRSIPQAKDRIVVETGYDSKKPRISGKSGTDNERILQENRRAELVVKSPSINSVGEFTPQLNNLLARNRELFLVAEGDKSKTEAALTAISKADSVRKVVLSGNPDLAGRVIAEDRIADKKSGISYSIDAQGVTYRPRERYPVSEQWKDPQPKENIIYIRRTGYDDATDWKLDIKSTDGAMTHTIAKGSGAPPDSVIWDWTIGEGRFMAPNTEYEVALTLLSKDKNIETASPKKLSVSQRQKVEAIENMLLVEFVFDESEPLSNYLERRMFSFASLFVARADSGYSQRAEIQGHTDDIGLERRNQELSAERAKREYDIMRRFIAYFAKTTPEKLDEWLSSRNSKLSFKGYGMQTPYVLRGKLIGDNKTAYGRSVNRRVTLEYYYQK
jgi:outer membrane protein OmpA-like peptidoglycan-associated protein